MENDKKIRLLICDADENVIKEISSALPENMELVGTAKDGAEALRLLDEASPDAVITEMILPVFDGLTIIEKAVELGKKVLVLSALKSDMLISSAIENGARYYMLKPFDRDLLYRRIMDMLGVHLLRNDTRKVNAGVRSRAMDEKITNIFLSVGIPAHIKGYQFLREAIKLAVESPNAINNITKQLYPWVAEVFETSPSKVERAIRHAIEVAWTRGRMENLNQIFGYKVYGRTDKPTNGEFIALIADRLILEKTA